MSRLPTAKTIIEKTMERRPEGGTRRTTRTVRETSGGENVNYLTGVGLNASARDQQSEGNKTTTSTKSYVTVDPCTGVRKTVTQSTRVTAPTDEATSSQAGQNLPCGPSSPEGAVGYGPTKSPSPGAKYLRSQPIPALQQMERQWQQRRQQQQQPPSRPPPQQQQQRQRPASQPPQQQQYSPRASPISVAAQSCVCPPPQQQPRPQPQPQPQPLQQQQQQQRSIPQPSRLQTPAPRRIPQPQQRPPPTQMRPCPVAGTSMLPQMSQMSGMPQTSAVASSQIQPPSAYGAPQRSRTGPPQMSRTMPSQMSRTGPPQMSRTGPPVAQNRPQAAPPQRPPPTAGPSRIQPPSRIRPPSVGPSRGPPVAAAPSRIQPSAAGPQPNVSGPSGIQRPSAAAPCVCPPPSTSQRSTIQPPSRSAPPSGSFAYQSSRQQPPRQMSAQPSMQAPRPVAPQMRICPQQPTSAQKPMPRKVTKTISRHKPAAPSEPIYQKRSKPLETRRSLAPQKSADPARQELEQTVQSELLNKSQWSSSKVEAAAGKVTTVPPPTEETQKGVEPVVQQIKLEKTIERTAGGEVVTKHFTGIDVEGGQAKKVDLNIQQLDPSKGTTDEAEVEVVTVTSSVTITPTIKKVTKIIESKTSGKDKTQLSPDQISQLVDEEAEDIDETLNMMRQPPKIVDDNPDKYPMKRKQLKFDLTPENLAALEKTVEPPVPTADDVQPTPTPEVIATIMNCIEKGENALDDLEEEQNKFLNISSVVPGPLHDAVVPVEAPTEIDDVLTEKEEHMMAAEKVPFADAYTSLSIDPPKPPERKVADNLTDQTPPWEGDYKQSITKSVGADDVKDIKKVDPKKLNNTQVCKVLQRGIDYFLHIEAIPYGSYVQLRGSAPPPWFPGYVVAVPEFTDTISIAKSPSEVFLKAWKAVEPRFFPDDSIITL